MKVIQNYTLTLKIVNCKKHIGLQSQSISDDNFYFKKSLHILEEGGSGVQVDHIEQVSV